MRNTFQSCPKLTKHKSTRRVYTREKKMLHNHTTVLQNGRCVRDILRLELEKVEQSRRVNKIAF